MNDTRIGYVVKRYPRYSETFIVNEILAHEQADLDMEIFSLRPSVDTHFQDLLAQVKSPVTFLNGNETIKSVDFWAVINRAGDILPDFWQKLSIAQNEEHRDVYQAILLAFHIQERKLTHLHAHFATSSTSVARLAAHFSGITYSFTAHAKDIFHEEVQKEDLWQKIHDAAAVITVSDYHVRFLEDKFTSSIPHMARIYNGLNLERFPYEIPNRQKNLILGVGRLVEKKGFNTLVDACALLKKRGVAFQCQMIGSGPLEDDLRTQINACQLQDRVELLGPLPQNEIIQLFRSASVMAAPCVIGEDGNQDGLPTVILEAMALGVPCVSTNVTGIPEAIVHDRTGLIVEKNNAEELADALEKLLTQEILGQSISKNARSLIEERFNIQNNAAEIRNVFKEIDELGGKNLNREMFKCK